jgi:hypothetical protein
LSRIDYNALVAWVGLGTALVAVLALWLEGRRWRFALGVELILRLEAEFRTARMYESRREVAGAFLSDNLTQASNALDEIINFYDGVGYFVERHALERKVVWNHFFSYMYRFWHYAQPYIESERRRDPTLWKSAGRLYHQLLRIEKKERGRLRAPLALSAGDLSQFLAAEARITEMGQGNSANPDRAPDG